MTITRADALEVMACVAACHPRTAPRWHDDPDAARFTADVWAQMFNRHNLIQGDLLTAVRNRAADTTDTAPEPGEIIQAARAVRRDRTDREQADPELRERREAELDAKVKQLVAPLAAQFGRTERPALRAVGSPTRRAAADPERMAKARAEIDTIRTP